MFVVTIIFHFVRLLFIFSISIHSNYSFPRPRDFRMTNERLSAAITVFRFIVRVPPKSIFISSAFLYREKQFPFERKCNQPPIVTECCFYLIHLLFLSYLLRLIKKISMEKRVENINGEACSDNGKWIVVIVVQWGQIIFVEFMLKLGSRVHAASVRHTTHRQMQHLSQPNRQTNIANKTFGWDTRKKLLHQIVHNKTSTSRVKRRAARLK